MGGGGGGVDNTSQIEAGTEAVVQKIDDTAAAAGTQMEGLGSQIGTASETGTTTAAGGTFTTPTSTDADGNVTGGEEVTYGGNEVAVSETVKGDTEQLIGGQSDLSSQIDTRFDTFQPVNVTNTTIDTSDLAKADAMNTGFETVGTAIGDVKTDTGNLLTGQTNLDTKLTGVGDQVTGLSSDVSDLSTNVDTGFTTMGTKLADAETNIKNYLQTEFGLTTDQITKLSQDVLSGQKSLNEIVTDLQTNQASQFATLTGNQQTMSDSLGGLQTGLTDFQTQYTGDTTLANQKRQELADSITGGFDTAQRNQQANFDAASNERANQMDAAASQTNATQQQNQVLLNNPDTQMAGVARNLAMGTSPTTDAGMAAQQTFMDRLNSIKAALTDGNVSLDPNTAALYTEVANAFDQNGKLVENSTDGQGMRRMRSMDNTGNLIVRILNQQGQNTDNRTINLDQVMSSINTSPQGGIMSSNLI